MNWTEYPIIMIKTVATGGLWTQGRIMEVAAIAFMLTADPLEPSILASFASFVHPGQDGLKHPDAAEVLAMRYLSVADLQQAPSFKGITGKLVSFVDSIASCSRQGGLSVAAFNAGHDYRLLAAEWLRSGFALPEWIECKPNMDASLGWIDPLIWCRDSDRRAPGGHSLDRQRERLGLPANGLANSALTDARDSAKVLNWLANGGHTGLTLARDGGHILSDRDVLLAKQDLLATGQSLDLQTFLYNKRLY